MKMIVTFLLHEAHHVHRRKERKLIASFLNIQNACSHVFHMVQKLLLEEGRGQQPGAEGEGRDVSQDSTTVVDHFKKRQAETQVAVLYKNPNQDHAFGASDNTVPYLLCPEAYDERQGKYLNPLTNELFLPDKETWCSEIALVDVIQNAVGGGPGTGEQSRKSSSNGRTSRASTRRTTATGAIVVDTSPIIGNKDGDSTAFSGPVYREALQESLDRYFNTGLGKKFYAVAFSTTTGPGATTFSSPSRTSLLGTKLKLAVHIVRRRSRVNEDHFVGGSSSAGGSTSSSSSNRNSILLALASTAPSNFDECSLIGSFRVTFVPAQGSDALMEGSFVIEGRNESVSKFVSVVDHFDPFGGGGPSSNWYSGGAGLSAGGMLHSTTNSLLASSRTSAHSQRHDLRSRARFRQELAASVLIEKLHDPDAVGAQIATFLYETLEQLLKNVEEAAKNKRDKNVQEVEEEDGRGVAGGVGIAGKKNFFGALLVAGRGGRAQESASNSSSLSSSLHDRLKATMSELRGKKKITSDHVYDLDSGDGAAADPPLSTRRATDRDRHQASKKENSVDIATLLHEIRRSKLVGGTDFDWGVGPRTALMQELSNRK
ncbi:unnamed protein product [Amoebophrya sp. A25]|nr:unnamed protein product [Amoebophrya sp. A25]|eukprot:GSA25T00012877001.1